MRLPRDTSGNDLIKALAALGYQPTRQRGSHFRLTTQQVGEHHVTVPLAAVAEYFNLTREQLLERLLGDSG